MAAGLNGNYHGSIDTKGRLEDLGVTYLGDGDWRLPAGAEITNTGGDDWQLTLADGTAWHVWSED